MINILTLLKTYLVILLCYLHFNKLTIERHSEIEYDLRAQVNIRCKTKIHCDVKGIFLVTETCSR